MKKNNVKARQKGNPSNWVGGSSSSTMPAVASLLLIVLVLCGCQNTVPCGLDPTIPCAPPKETVSAAERHKTVLSMKPVGYWAADELISGSKVRDLSATANHATNNHVPWDEKKGLLNFTGAYQWLEIPAHKAYQTPSFSMGGWVFMRSKVIGSGWVNKMGFRLIGNESWVHTVGTQLCIRKQELIDVVSGGKGDQLGTWSYKSVKDGKRVEHGYGSPNLPIGTWHHLLYTYQPKILSITIYQEEGVVMNPRLKKPFTGTGTLYLNGKKIASKAGIPYTPVNKSLQIGNDAAWWHQMAAKSGSLDGAVRDMVWFDRAITGEEVARLHTITQPTKQPEVHGDSVVVLDGRAIEVHDIASLSPSTRRTALLLFGAKSADALQPLSDQLVPELKKALNEPHCRLVATELLLKLNKGAELDKVVPLLRTVVTADRVLSKRERADAALALAAMGSRAAQAIPALTEALDNIVPRGEVHPPRVDELLRNALTKALFDIDPEKSHTNHALERTFAQPLMKALDLQGPQLVTNAEKGGEQHKLRSLIEKGAYQQALALYSKLPQSMREYYFSHKDPKDRDYTATAHYNGATYKVGTGVAWQGVEKVPVEEYKTIVAKLAKKYPSATNWHKPDYEHLYRVPLTKIGADGVTQKVYLEGNDFILDGTDAKCRAWSLFVDEQGYVHLMGGQHNAPNPTQYIPGSWEKMGVSRDKKSDTYPMQMYWVSTAPESIDSFRFVGQRNNPQAIPASYLNYFCFVQSPTNETYLYGRSKAFGWQCWGMYRYTAATKKWKAIGGDVYDLIQSARKHDPEWLHYLHDPIRGSLPTKPSDIRRLAWAWQPPFYNFCRDGWGVRFDKTGRMHVRMVISGLDGKGYVRPTSVYAWSDDGGETFHRADGTVVKLPLTVNPAPEHNAEIAVSTTQQKHDGGQFETRQWWELWLGLIGKAGYRVR